LERLLRCTFPSLTNCLELMNLFHGHRARDQTLNNRTISL
jgi:hypothetical protein